MMQIERWRVDKREQIGQTDGSDLHRVWTHDGREQERNGRLEKERDMADT